MYNWRGTSCALRGSAVWRGTAMYFTFNRNIQLADFAAGRTALVRKKYCCHMLTDEVIE
jgi:hypothetical protein